MTSRLRVLQVATSDMSLRYLLRPQLEALRAAGHEVILASAPGADSRQMQDDGFEFHPLANASQGWGLTADLRLVRELTTLMRRLRPDVVHTHIQKTGVIGRVAARLARVPRIVNTQHGFYAIPEDGMKRKLPVYSLERIAAACSHVELVQNPEDFRVLQQLRVPERRLRYLCNGVDIQRFRPPLPAERAEARGRLGLNPDDVVVCGVGRLVASKGWPTLARAVAGLPVTTLLAGPLQAGKAEALDPTELAPIRYLGHLDRSEELYWASDILALPSSGREGLPRAAIEAAACGLPVVGTDARGVRSVVADGITGRLVPRDDPASLRRVLLAFVDDRAVRERMGRAGRARVEQFFDEQQVIDRVLAAVEGRPVPAAAFPA